MFLLQKRIVADTRHDTATPAEFGRCSFESGRASGSRFPGTFSQVVLVETLPDQGLDHRLPADI